MAGAEADHPALIYDAAAVARADRLVICVPGALTRVSIFEAVLDWRASGWEPVFYPFPGLDGRPLDPPLDISQAADQIIAFARQHADKPVCLLGFSTGGAVVVSAACGLGATVKTAAIAPALPQAGGWRTMLATTRDILAAALRVRSLAVRRVWLAYYRTLLVGRAGLRDRERSAFSDAVTQASTDQMVYPEGGMMRAHARSLGRWAGPGRKLPAPAQVAFFIGTEDPVFSPRQTRAFAADLGGVVMREYPGQGHMLFLTHAEVFDDVLAFFDHEDPAVIKRAGLSN